MLVVLIPPYVQDHLYSSHLTAWSPDSCALPSFGFYNTHSHQFSDSFLQLLFSLFISISLLRVGSSYGSFLTNLFAICILTSNFHHTRDFNSHVYVDLHKSIPTIHISFSDFWPKYSSIDLTYACGCHRHLKLNKSPVELIANYSPPVFLLSKTSVSQYLNV